MKLERLTAHFAASSNETKLWKTYDSYGAAEKQIDEWQRNEDPNSQWHKSYRIAKEDGRYVIYQSITKKHDA